MQCREDNRPRLCSRLFSLVISSMFLYRIPSHFFQTQDLVRSFYIYVCLLPFHFFPPFSRRDCGAGMIEVDVTSTAEVTYTGDGCVLKDLFLFLFILFA